MDIIKFFKHPVTAGQRQYEALRTYFLDDIPGKDIARRYGYTYAAFNSLKQKFKSGQLQFFITPPKGPKGARVSTELQERIITYRKKNLSAYQIAEILETQHEGVSVSTITRILADEGFTKLPRRTQLKIGLTKDNTLTPEYAKPLDIDQLEGLEVECAVGGIFLFMPLLAHFNMPSVIKKAKLPGSPDITAFQYGLSILALKLVGKERLSHIKDFNFDKGFGLFAGLNVLPKTTALSTYSYRLDQKDVHRFMKHFVEAQDQYKIYGSGTINIDFHTIQHYGEEAMLEEHWSGNKGKRVKGALTFIAQDCDSRCQIYVNSDIYRHEADDEILGSVDISHW